MDGDSILKFNKFEQSIKLRYLIGKVRVSIAHLGFRICDIFLLYLITQNKIFLYFIDRPNNVYFILFLKDNHGFMDTMFTIFKATNISPIDLNKNVYHLKKGNHFNQINFIFRIFG